MSCAVECPGRERSWSCLGAACTFVAALCDLLTGYSYTAHFMEFYWNMSLELLQGTHCFALSEALSGMKSDHCSPSRQTVYPCYIRCNCHKPAHQRCGVRVQALGEVCVIAGKWAGLSYFPADYWGPQGKGENCSCAQKPSAGSNGMWSMCMRINTHFTLLLWSQEVRERWVLQLMPSLLTSKTKWMGI